jgi:hypothetical protein
MGPVIAWLRKLWHRPTDDPAWKATGIVIRFTGHDEALGVAAVQRADRAAVQRRRIEAARGRP